MPASTISASAIYPNAWKHPKKLADEVAFEFSVGGLHCTCFDRERAAALKQQAEVRSDLISTVIPAGLQLVRDPFGNTADAYREAGFTPVLRGNRSIATYFVDALIPGDPLDALRDQIENLAIADPCCADDVPAADATVAAAPASTKGMKAMFGGGKTCSTIMFASEASSIPLVFHLKMDDVWDGRGAPGSGILDKGLDHFLIPSKSPGNSVVWLAIERSDDPQQNHDNLKQWERGNYRFAAFDGVLYTSDTLKISVALDAHPAG